MMVPPTIRMGSPEPYPQTTKRGYMLLVRERGWLIAKFDYATGIYMDQDARVPLSWRYIDPSHILCWLPEDGS